MEELNTPEKIAQWVVDKRYPKSELEKVSDSELYNTIYDSIVSVKDSHTIYVKQAIKEQYRSLIKFYDEIFDRIMLVDTEEKWKSILKIRELINNFRKNRSI